MDKFPLTKEGFTALEQELKNLKGVERPNIIAAIAEARSHGDLSENAEYSAAKEKQSFIEGRIQELEAVISRAQVIDPSLNKATSSASAPWFWWLTKTPTRKANTRSSATMRPTSKKTRFPFPRRWPRR